MAHVAIAVARGKEGWTATEVSLADVADLDDVADQLRDINPDADVSLLFVESDDAYLVIVRLDATDDLRVFGTDSAFARESRLGGLLLDEVTGPAVAIEDALAAAESDEPRPTGGPDAEPVGDADLLADLGVSSDLLLEICTREGMLPADMTSELAQLIGCGDEVEELREA